MDPENPVPPIPPVASPDPVGSEVPTGADPGSNPYAPGAGTSPLDPPAPVQVSTLRAVNHPSYVFLAVVAIVSLASDIASKTWAEKHLDGFPGLVSVWKDHIAFVLAKNKGGAWGLLQGTSENVRRPFFLLVSVAAIAFIVTLYRRLLPTQKALKWGLPLVLGGALGNVFDRIRYGHVIDFIDIHVVWKGKDHHWPTFNVADIAICVGVGLMAIDMFTSKRGRANSMPPPADIPVFPEPPAALPPVSDGGGASPLVTAPLPATPSGEDKP
jgi:signal peptidase II